MANAEKTHRKVKSSVPALGSGQQAGKKKPGEGGPKIKTKKKRDSHSLDKKEKKNDLDKPGHAPEAKLKPRKTPAIDDALDKPLKATERPHRGSMPTILPSEITRLREEIQAKKRISPASASSNQAGDIATLATRPPPPGSPPPARGLPSLPNKLPSVSQPHPLSTLKPSLPPLPPPRTQTQTQTQTQTETDPALPEMPKTSPRPLSPMKVRQRLQPDKSSPRAENANSSSVSATSAAPVSMRQQFTDFLHAHADELEKMGLKEVLAKVRPNVPDRPASDPMEDIETAFRKTDMEADQMRTLVTVGLELKKSPEAFGGGNQGAAMRGIIMRGGGVAAEALHLFYLSAKASLMT